MFTLAPWLIWITRVAGALLTPVLARIHSKRPQLRGRSLHLAAAILATYTALTVAAGDSSSGLAAVIPTSGWGESSAGRVLVDPLSMFMINIVAGSAS